MSNPSPAAVTACRVIAIGPPSFDTERAGVADLVQHREHAAGVGLWSFLRPSGTRPPDSPTTRTPGLFAPAPILPTVFERDVAESVSVTLGVMCSVRGRAAVHHEIDRTFRRG